MVLETVLGGMIVWAALRSQLHRERGGPSMPHVIALTVLFAMLTAVVLAAHLHLGKGEKFTLFSVAATLRG